MLFRSTVSSAEKDVSKMTRKSKPAVLSSSKPILDVQSLPTNAGPRACDPGVILTRHHSNVLSLAFQRVLRGKGRYVPPPKGTFTSATTRSTEIRPSKFDLTTPSPKPINDTTYASTNSHHTLVYPSTSGSSAPFVTFCSCSKNTLVVQERLPTRDEWNKRSAERHLERKRSREERLASLNENGRSLYDLSPYMNQDPIAISNTHIGGCIGLDAAPSANVPRHFLLGRNGRNKLSPSKQPLSSRSPLQSSLRVPPRQARRASHSSTK